MEPPAAPAAMFPAEGDFRLISAITESSSGSARESLKDLPSILAPNELSSWGLTGRMREAISLRFQAMISVSLSMMSKGFFILELE